MKKGSEKMTVQDFVIALGKDCMRMLLWKKKESNKDKIVKWEWSQEKHDWINEDGERLTGYEPSEEDKKFVEFYSGKGGKKKDT